MAFIISTLLASARDIVPFEIDTKNNLPIVEVYVNNDSVPFNFVFDTGCSVVMANANNNRLMKLLNLCETDMKRTLWIMLILQQSLERLHLTTR